jgi:predicted signal transduction protein with EAL and GGDEF domain
MLEGLRRTLRADFEVETALGAAAGIRAVESGEPFNVVVSDQHMPDMDGLTFLRWVAAHSPDTAAILLTGNANLVTAIAAVNSGHIFRFLTKPCAKPELVQAIQDGDEQYAARRAQRLLVSQSVDHDALTGLPDRRRFLAEVARLRENNPGASLSLVVVSIDELALVRRTLGHVAADNLMIAAARQLQAAVGDPRCMLWEASLFRIEDRLALLWCEQSTMSAEQVAEHLIGSLQTEVSVTGHIVRLDAHAGIAGVIADSAGSPLGGLTALRNAEDACLEAIAGGSTRIAHFSASANIRKQRRLQLSQRLRHPQFASHLACVYQPQWDLRHNAMAGLEALVRWHDPELGMISPAEFVPLAEEDPDVARRLGDTVLRLAAGQRQAWRSSMPDVVRVAVNISAAELLTGDLHERVMQSLAETGLPAALLEIEITESASIADFAKSESQMRKLRSEGVSIAIDDFGIGFSSLSYLAALPADSLKIDRSFIHGVDIGSSRAALLRGICGLGNAMGMLVIAEGVEHLSTASWLRTIGCDVVQGFGIARPMTGAAFEDWYRDQEGRIAAALSESHARPELALAASSG